MTPSEFKAWFEGFTEAFSGCPTKAQWARVKERVAEIDDKSVTERIYLDRYWPQWVRYTNWVAPSLTTTGGVGVGTSTAVLPQNAQANFCASSAMFALGKADAASLAA